MVIDFLFATLPVRSATFLWNKNKTTTTKKKKKKKKKKTTKKKQTNTLQPKFVESVCGSYTYYKKYTYSTRTEPKQLNYCLGLLVLLKCR